MRPWLPLAAPTLALALVAGLATPALAGPPLICHPFTIGNSPSLPWGEGTGWNTPRPGYDVSGLTAETLRLLAPEAPILARMETLRRATIYAAQDPAVARDLLAAVAARTRSKDGAPHALAFFDAGYLVEAYRQAGFDRGPEVAKLGRAGGWTLRDELAGLDGYGWLQKALLITGPQPEIEFAASLMKEGASSEAHRRRALAGAKAGSLLAQNLR